MAPLVPLVRKAPLGYLEAKGNWETLVRRGLLALQDNLEKLD
jgi:hypothetical protein